VSRTRSFALVLTGLLFVASLLAACSPSGASPSASSGSLPTVASTATSGQVDPTREATHPDPAFDYGFTVLITDSGFQPHWLVSECCQTITWKNTSSSPVVVAFDHQQVRSQPIPAGGTFTWLPKNIQSVTYHDMADADRTGTIQVNPTFES
jgi:hypothetical protein